MLVFAAITPHSPLLLPSIGKDQEKQLAKTLEAFHVLRDAFREARPDTVLLISPHGPTLADALTMNLHETYEGDLTGFGDIATRPHLHPDPELVDHLKRLLRKKEMPVTLISSHAIDYGIVVPLRLLDSSLPKIIPMGPPMGLDLKTHHKIGEIIKDELVLTTKRVAVIASSDLSHRLSSDTPAGFSPRGEEFDEAVRKSIETKNTSRILSLPKELVDDAAPCGLRPIVMLLGLLSEVAYESRTLAYEHPFGVGYLTVEFELN